MCLCRNRTSRYYRRELARAPNNESGQSRRGGSQETGTVTLETQWFMLN